MTELILQGQKHIIDNQYLQGALAALIDLGWGDVSVDPSYSRVYEVVPSSEKSTVLLNQTAYQFPRNDKVAQDFLTGARSIYKILGRKFSGRIYYSKTVNLDKDVLGVIAANASPLTQLYMKHVAKTKLSQRTEEYEKLFREKNYQDLLILASKDGDTETIRKIFSLYHKPLSKNYIVDRQIVDRFLNDKVMRCYLRPYYISRFNLPQFHKKPYVKTDRNIDLYFAWNNEAAAIAVSNNRLDILQLLESLSPLSNRLNLMKIAAFLGYDEIIEYIRKIELDYHILFILLPAIEGKQLETYKKYLPFLTRDPIMTLTIYLMIFERGTPEMLEHTTTILPYNSDLNKVVNIYNKDMFRYLYHYSGDEKLNIYKQLLAGKMNAKKVHSGLIYCGMIDELRIFELRFHFALDDRDFFDAFGTGSVALVDYISPIIQRRFEYCSGIPVNSEVFNYLVDHNHLYVDRNSPFEAKLSFARNKIEGSDWQTAVEIYQYFDVPMDPQIVFVYNDIDFLKYYQQHNPDKTPDIMENRALSRITLDFFIEYERLYGPIEIEYSDQEEIIDNNIAIFMYLVKMGRIEKTKIDWETFLQYKDTESDTLSIQYYIDKLHEMNDYARLVEYYNSLLSKFNT
jgi:hypothetical protein